MNISFWSLEQLNRWESSRFLHDVIDFTDPYSEEMPELFNTKFENLRTAYEAYDEALVQERKVAPEELVEAEQGRDLALRKIYALVREYSKFPYEKEKEDAGNVLMHVFQLYGTGNSIASMPQDEETMVIINLVQDLMKDVATQEAIVTLGLTPVIDTLKGHNKVFIETQQQRVKDDARTVVGIVKATRTQAQNDFVSFAEIINALALVEGEEKYADLKLEINRLHKVVVDRAKQRTNKKEEDTNPEVTE